jgi:carbon monoxide dehydrogenase subunit G
MDMERSFTASRSFDQVSDMLGHEDTLLSLFPGKTEIVERSGDRITTRTHYTALGREGVATFHLEYTMDGGLRFEKVCDGNVWKALRGEVELEDLGEQCRVVVRLAGQTKRLVPEFTIKGPMEDQIGEMSEALEAKLSAG